jgi:carbonic anhydrase/acetyltransferase-like protein (isoleucine patch superfamily)
MIELGTPRISRSVFVDRSAAIIGDVTIGDGVLIAPNASIRADEPGSRIVIGAGCNVQDNAVLHAVSGSVLNVGRGTTLAHGCIVHGPCTIGEGCFIGFGSVVFQSTLSDGCVVLHRAVVNRVTVPSARLIASGTVIEGRLERRHHSKVTPEVERFVESVREVNLELVATHRRTGRHAPPDGAG